MPTDFVHGYNPPGVYIDDTPSALVASTGLPPTVVAIVGPSVDHRHSVEQFTLATAGYRLAQRGIALASVVVTKVSDGSTVSALDYTLTPTSSPTSSSNYYVDITRAGGGSLSSDTPVFIEYDYTDPDYYEPRRYSSYEDVKDAYGEPLNLTPPSVGQSDYVAVTSPLSLAAQIAFENGAGELVLCATTPPPNTATTTSAISGARRTALSAAYAKVSSDYDVTVIVPITDEIIDGDAAGVGVDLLAHLNSSAAGGYYRVGVLGLPPAITIAPDTLVNTGGFRSSRLVLAYAAPGGMSYFHSASSQSISLGHQYLAAAYAGRLSAVPVQKALTREIVRSFSGIIGTPLSRSTKDQYSAMGVAVAEPDRLGRVVVRHGLTTDTSSLEVSELSLVRSKDALVTLLDVGVDNSALLGQPIDENTPLLVKGVIAGLLEHAKISGVIVDYTDLQVRQQSTNPSVIEAKFAYMPPYPTNYILVSFTISVVTGDTTVAA